MVDPRDGKLRGLGLFRLASHLPLPVLHGIGGLIGLIFALVPNLHRHITRVNLALCMPEMRERERNRIARRSLVETGKTAMELALLWLAPGRRVVGLVREVRGGDAVEEALARGRGVILAGPHLGAWEMVGLYASSRWPLTALYRPPRVQALGALIRKSRERLGGTLVPTDAGGVRSLLKSLRAGEVAGILPDQDPHEQNGLFVPFFGVPANTITLLSRLAAKSGAPVFVAFAERLSRGRGYQMQFLPVDGRVNSDDPRISAEALNEAVEAVVRRYPEQYQWNYRRFRTRPPGEPELYHESGRLDPRHPLSEQLPRSLVAR